MALACLVARLCPYILSLNQGLPTNHDQQWEKRRHGRDIVHVVSWWWVIMTLFKQKPVASFEIATSSNDQRHLERRRGKISRVWRHLFVNAIVTMATPHFTPQMSWPLTIVKASRWNCTSHCTIHYLARFWSRARVCFIDPYIVPFQAKSVTLPKQSVGLTGVSQGLMHSQFEITFIWPFLFILIINNLIFYFF